MLVFPEFPEIEELQETEDFAKKVSKLLTDKRKWLRFFLDLQRLIRRFSSVDPVEIDKEGSISDEILHGLKKLGLYGMRLPKEFGKLDLPSRNTILTISFSGGLEFNDKQATRVYEELGRDWSLMLNVYTHQDLVAYAIKTYGTEEQKRKYLPRLASGESIGAFCLHEDVSGYDTAALKTTAVPLQGPEASGRIILNGKKNWVTNGKVADILIVFGKYITAHLEEDAKQVWL